MYEQHESCTFTGTLLGFPEYMYKIKDHGSRIAAWLIPVYQETYITTRLHEKKACEHALHLRKCEWWIICKTRCNGHAWKMREQACLQDWRMDRSFLLFWKFPLFLVRSRLKSTFKIQIYLTKTINDLPSTIVFYFFPPVIWYKAGKM